MAKDGRKLATRARILDAAVQHFAHRGFHDATVKAIADLAAVATATVHWHFETKSELYAEAVEVAGDRFMAVMQRPSGREPFAGLAERWLAHFADSDNATRLLRSLAGDHRHWAVGDAGSRVNDRFVEFWCRWLRGRRGGHKPATQTPDKVLGRLIVAALTGLVATDYARGDTAVALLDNLARWVGTAAGSDGDVSP